MTTDVPAPTGSRVDVTGEDIPGVTRRHRFATSTTSGRTSSSSSTPGAG